MTVEQKYFATELLRTIKEIAGKKEDGGQLMPAVINSVPKPALDQPQFENRELAAANGNTKWWLLGTGIAIALIWGGTVAYKRWHQKRKKDAEVECKQLHAEFNAIKESVKSVKDADVTASNPAPLQLPGSSPAPLPNSQQSPAPVHLDQAGYPKLPAIYPSAT